MNQSLISKSAFIKAEQCLKQFYLYKNHPFLKDKLSREKQFIFKRGTDVGIFAQQLFPSGIDVTEGEKRDQLAFAEKTKQLIAAGVNTIYEATFIYDNLLVMVDILHKHEDKWIAYEVKSSLKITETYVKDACFQYYVIKNNLPDLIDFNLLTLNPKYTLNKEINKEHLFKTTSVLKDAIKNAPYFSHQSQIAKTTLEQGKIPDIKIGEHCFQPYQCDFMGTCWKDLSGANSVLSLGKLTKKEVFNLYDNNIKWIHEIEENAALKHEIKIQVQAVKEQKEQLRKEELTAFFKDVKYPICSLDIEVWMPAIPFYEGTKPFELIPFLFSMTFEENGTIVSKSFFKEIEEDDRLVFLLEIIDATKAFATILVFDKSLEENVLNQLAVLFPERLTDIEEIKRKMLDLSLPIKQGNYYHPEMKGNFTLKSIIPIVNPQLNFDELTIQSGVTAMYLYESTKESISPIEKESIKQELINYCEMDALATHQLFHYLENKL
jgi:hypothetical protein